MCECGTIHQIHTRLVSEGYHISEYALRLWIKQGRLPAIPVGRKNLIQYGNVMAILSAAQVNCAQ